MMHLLHRRTLLSAALLCALVVPALRRTSIAAPGDTGPSPQPPQLLVGHPQAVTDCANCHLGADGEPDLQGIHDNDCARCHPGFDFGVTILGPIGTWDGECAACHNPCVFETGYRPTKTPGHRCIACHGRQMNTGNPRAFHREHIESANCVVCHGFIPDVGTEIGSGNRAICATCHTTGEYEGTSQRSFHRKHIPQGLSCLECHGDVRPPIDVVDGPPVGSSTNVCQICHSDEDPSEFARESQELHKKHTDKSIGCGSCHMAANLQDDRVPMPPIDDPVRSRLNRSGFNECSHCHEDGGDGPLGLSEDNLHEKHVAEQWQWCYNCHEGDDGRPLGLEPPVTEPAEACALCHENESYRDNYPFAVHREHAEKNKCYTCHQAIPPVFDWPVTWDESEECACPADIDFNDNVDFMDVLPLLLAWGDCGGCQEDVTRDGIVDFQDVLAIVEAWGPCP